MNNTETASITITLRKADKTIWGSRYSVIANGQSVGWVVKSGRTWSAYASADEFYLQKMVDEGAATRRDAIAAIISEIGINRIHQSFTYNDYKAWYSEYLEIKYS